MTTRSATTLSPFLLAVVSAALVGSPGCGTDASVATDAGPGGGPGGGPGVGADGGPLVGADGGLPGAGDASIEPGTDGGNVITRDASGAPPSSAGGLAGKIGKPLRLLVGLGGGNEPAVIKTQGLHPDLYERYLVNVGAGAWPTWNSPSGAYVNVVAADADAMGAVPMFTLYQMATNGDGNLTDITDATFMAQFWDDTRLLFQRLAIYGKPALVNVEPDFWGYVEQASPGGDPTKLAAKVTLAADCAAIPDTAAGIVSCVLHIARTYAPRAYVGFSPSWWGGPTIADVVTYFKAVGAGQADFVVMQTLDRDAGCFEAASEADCVRQGAGWYWDESNATHPSFHDHLADAKTIHDALALPLVWWQTPLGVPSATAGGTPNHYRDNRAHYFLTHATELVAAGGLGVVFGAGATNETDITTDNGQMKALSAAYLANPAPLK